jgi:hypothetical protein
MYFNPTDKSNSIIADIDFLLFGDGSTFNSDYSIEDRTRNVNIALDEVVAELFKADPNFMWDDTTNPDFPIATIDLEEGKDHYTIPDETLVIHRMRVKDRNGSWVTLTPVMRRELTDSELASSGTPSKYYKIDNALFPIPVPDYGATGGVELEFQRGANHFTTTDTNKKPGFNPQFHQYLSVGAALRYALANGMDNKVSYLQAEKERIEMAIQEHYARRSPDVGTKLKLKRQPISNYGL